MSDTESQGFPKTGRRGISAALRAPGASAARRELVLSGCLSKSTASTRMVGSLTPRARSAAQLITGGGLPPPDHYQQWQDKRRAGQAAVRSRRGNRLTAGRLRAGEQRVVRQEEEPDLEGARAG